MTLTMRFSLRVVNSLRENIVWFLFVCLFLPFLINCLDFWRGYVIHLNFSRELTIKPLKYLLNLTIVLGILVDFVHMIIEGFFFFLALMWFSFDKWFSSTTLYWCITCFLLMVTALLHFLTESDRGSRGYIWPELGLSLSHS